MISWFYNGKGSKIFPDLSAFLGVQKITIDLQ